jgi:hypothetical protein
MSRRPDGGGISQETEDAIVNALASRLVEKTAPSGRSVFSEVLDGMTDAERRLVEDSLDRHAARMRAKGDPGW